ncbi:MAG: HEAT repeat domain-containing protein [Verrucomicrobia bacterium]|nr:HEAT repeat domain-containing protein [Verrucomicrobiota bacterium]
MRHALPFALCGLLLASTSPTRPAEFKFPKHNITVPDGFEVELVAGPPLTDRPITADFDEQGRLYVTDSSGSNEKPEKQLELKPHRIVRLEDTDGDGKFEKSSVFADKLMFPEGCLWYDGSVYVSAPPSIWKFTDTDNDGVADQREEWFQGKTLTGCANDLHGPVLGPDGWIYWCKGAFAKQSYERPGKTPFVTRASHIFRSRPDGSGIEPVLTGGMDNPVSVAFTAGGERLMTGTFFVHPGGGQRDGIIHAIYGGVYGKEHDVLDDHKRTGDLMPIMTHHGPSASTYLIRWRSRAFGDDYQDNLFACLFNLRKVTRHVLEPDGASFRTKDTDFFVSDNPDFHPTQVIEDADGSLVVVDTGGWYKICCPTSQLWKPDVLGAIYRVRKKGAPRIADPRGLKLAWSTMKAPQLANLLDNPRPAVQDRAMHQLGKLASEATPALADALKSASVLKRLNAVWALTRIEGDSARASVRAALSDAETTVRQAAVHSVSVWRDAAAASRLLELLTTESAPLKRVAAEALGRIGDPRTVGALLDAAATPDRVLEHSLIYALTEMDNPQAVEDGIREESRSPVMRAALIALDQMDHGGLKPERVANFLVHGDSLLKQAASWIASHHPEWGGALAGFFRDQLAAQGRSEAERGELQRLLSQFGRDAAIQELLAATLREETFAKDARLCSLRAMAQSGVKETPAGWCTALLSVLSGSDVDLRRQAVTTARALPAPKQGAADLGAALLRVARDVAAAAEMRLDALAAVPGGLSAVEPDLFDFLHASLDAAKPVAIRSSASSVLARARLSAGQLTTLAESFKTVGPLEIGRLLSAFDKATDQALGLTLVDSLKQCSAASALRAETLMPHLTNFPSVVQQKADDLLASLNTDAAEQNAHVDELLAALKDGDIRRGQAIFNSEKTACSACHAIGYLGGNNGPDLTRIGQIRTERDLLEAVVYPSASFVRSYEPMVVATKAGEDYSGVVRKDAPDEVVLATGPNAEVRLARADIVEMRPGTVSIMPQGLDEQLTKQELADLIAFLRATRW